MAGNSAIRYVGETLITLLQRNLSNIYSDLIVLGSPGEIRKEVQLSLFLYQVLENSYMKNLEMQKVGTDKLKYPPLTLDLYYMLTSHPAEDTTESTYEAHLLLGRAMQVFYDNSILSGSGLNEILASEGDELRITLNPTSLDDITKIWNTFQGRPLRPSVCYIVTPVKIDSIHEQEIKRVVSKKTEEDEMVPKKGEK
jgi:hypothetical protein